MHFNDQLPDVGGDANISRELHIKGKPDFEFMQVLYASGFPETIFN